MPTEDYDHLDLSRPYRCAACGVGLRYRPEDGWCDACSRDPATLAGLDAALAEWVDALLASGATQRHEDDPQAVAAPSVALAGRVERDRIYRPRASSGTALQASVLGRNIGFEKAEVEPWRR